MIKGAPVTPEASTISGASATTEVQNNSAEVQNNSASASDPVDAEAPAKILIPLEHCQICTKNSKCLLNCPPVEEWASARARSSRASGAAGCRSARKVGQTDRTNINQVSLEVCGT